MLSRKFSMLRVSLSDFITNQAFSQDPSGMISFDYSASLRFRQVTKRNTTIYEQLYYIHQALGKRHGVNYPYTLSESLQSDYLYDIITVELKDTVLDYVAAPAGQEGNGTESNPDGQPEKEDAGADPDLGVKASSSYRQDIYDKGFTITEVPLDAGTGIYSPGSKTLRDLHYSAFISSASNARKAEYLFVRDDLAVSPIVDLADASLGNLADTSVGQPADTAGLMERITLNLVACEHKNQQPGEQAPVIPKVNSEGMPKQPEQQPEQAPVIPKVNSTLESGMVFNAAKLSAYIGLAQSDGASINECAARLRQLKQMNQDKQKNPDEKTSPDEIEQLEKLLRWDETNTMVIPDIDNYPLNADQVAPFVLTMQEQSTLPETDPWCIKIENSDQTADPADPGQTADSAASKDPVQQLLANLTEKNIHEINNLEDPAIECLLECAEKVFASTKLPDRNTEIYFGRMPLISRVQEKGRNYLPLFSCLFLAAAYALANLSEDSSASIEFTQKDVTRWKEQRIFRQSSQVHNTLMNLIRATDTRRTVTLTASRKKISLSIQADGNVRPYMPELQRPKLLWGDTLVNKVNSAVKGNDTGAWTDYWKSHRTDLNEVFTQSNWAGNAPLNQLLQIIHDQLQELCAAKKLDDISKLEANEVLERLRPVVGKNEGQANEETEFQTLHKAYQNGKGYFENVANSSDGMGFATPEVFEAIEKLLTGKEPDPDPRKRLNAIIIRLPFIKGVLIKLDFHKIFREQINELREQHILEETDPAYLASLKDVYDIERQLVDENDCPRIKVIFTESMFKGCKMFKQLPLPEEFTVDTKKASKKDSKEKPKKDFWKAYWQLCNQYQHSLLIAGKNTAPGNTVRLNYQFLSTMDITEDDLRDMVRAALDRYTCEHLADKNPILAMKHVITNILAANSENSDPESQQEERKDQLNTDASSAEEQPDGQKEPGNDGDPGERLNPLSMDDASAEDQPDGQKEPVDDGDPEDRMNQQSMDDASAEEQFNEKKLLLQLLEKKPEIWSSSYVRNTILKELRSEVIDRLMRARFTVPGDIRLCVGDIDMLCKKIVCRAMGKGNQYISSPINDLGRHTYGVGQYYAPGRGAPWNLAWLKTLIRDGAENNPQLARRFVHLLLWQHTHPDALPGESTLDCFLKAALDRIQALYGQDLKLWEMEADQDPVAAYNTLMLDEATWMAAQSFRADKAPVNQALVMSRNPHLSRGESVIVAPLDSKALKKYNRRYGHLTGVVFCPNLALYAIGGADLDGDRVNLCTSFTIMEAVSRGNNSASRIIQDVLTKKEELIRFCKDNVREDSLFALLEQNLGTLPDWPNGGKVRMDCAIPLIFAGSNPQRMENKTIDLAKGFFSAFQLTGEQRIGLDSYACIEATTHCFTPHKGDNSAKLLHDYLTHWWLWNLALQTGLEIDMAKTSIRAVNVPLMSQTSCAALGIEMPSARKYTSYRAFLAAYKKKPWLNQPKYRFLSSAGDVSSDVELLMDAASAVAFQFSKASYGSALDRLPGLVQEELNKREKDIDRLFHLNDASDETTAPGDAGASRDDAAVPGNDTASGDDAASDDAAVPGNGTASKTPRKALSSFLLPGASRKELRTAGEEKTTPITVDSMDIDGNGVIRPKSGVVLKTPEQQMCFLITAYLERINRIGEEQGLRQVSSYTFKAICSHMVRYYPFDEGRKALNVLLPPGTGKTYLETSMGDEHSANIVMEHVYNVLSALSPKEDPSQTDDPSRKDTPSQKDAPSQKNDTPQTDTPSQKDALLRTMNDKFSAFYLASSQQQRAKVLSDLLIEAGSQDSHLTKLLLHEADSDKYTAPEPKDGDALAIRILTDEFGIIVFKQLLKMQRTNQKVLIPRQYILVNAVTAAATPTAAEAGTAAATPTTNQAEAAKVIPTSVEALRAALLELCDQDQDMIYRVTRHMLSDRAQSLSEFLFMHLNQDYLLTQLK